MKIYLRGIWVWFNSFAYATSNRRVLTEHYKNSWGDGVEIRVDNDRVLFDLFKNHTTPFCIACLCSSRAPSLPYATVRGRDKAD